YVGITRAQEHLLISHTRYRYTYGKMTDQERSRFLDEIPASHLPLNDCSFWKNPQFETFFNQWFYSGAPEQKKSEIYVPAKRSSTALSKDTQEQEAQKEESVVSDKKSQFKKNQPVKHAKFGVGVVQKIEDDGEGTVYVTALFKIGTK